MITCAFGGAADDGVCLPVASTRPGKVDRLSRGITSAGKL